MSETPKSPVSAKEKPKSKVSPYTGIELAQDYVYGFRGGQSDEIIFDDVRSQEEDHPWLNNLRDHARMLSCDIKIPHHAYCGECKKARKVRDRYRAAQRRIIENG